jgi:DNA-directed RNA polymerase specialized sigma24 family protein
VEDLVQEMDVKDCRCLGQFERGINLKAWFHTIRHNIFLNLRCRAGLNPVVVGSEIVERLVDDGDWVATSEQLHMRVMLSVDF